MRAYASSEESEVVRMKALDDCHPATFNAAVGPGTCNVAFRGETKFSEFINQLREDKRADDWKFSEDDVELRTGDTLVIASRGGEFHTFTQVAGFGGGIIGLLNVLSGNPVTPVPECSRVAAVEVPAGPGGLPIFVLNGPSASNIFMPSFLSGVPPSTGSLTAGGSVLTPGTHLFQCCIHPWMRATVTVGK